ncbi:MAG: hypothetical protein COX79_04045 [Candidatus Levybacteria bacterium CG_4_10_14_0_2_um_filter_36_16]|nr:MAG: hypothetical protein COU26_03510 [Candidatus Levybacteria bacterium CG10_big_fil_rev_8_21_14_0_10_36_30]PIZ96911.1 MAG: hypothetical protein COX79_04045 [Candidatus Levybacteria bacterium CG_4_10_14_0_2_um_filter_36_16]
MTRDITKKKIVEVYFRDEGERIPKEKRKSIFKRFYQLITHSEKGFGLGLYISEEIIKSHKGKIWVDSTVGKGSTFYFTLHTC